MKSQNRVSQLTLELYYRGLATNKERRLVKKALETDSETRKEYEALQESYREIRRIVMQELKRRNIPERPENTPVPSPRKKKVVLILAAAVLLCALIPAILYLKNSGSNKDRVMAEETTHETNEEETDFLDEIPDMELAGNFADEPPEPQIIRERGNSNNRREGNTNSRTEIVETPRAEPVRSAEPELRLDPGTAAEVEGRGSLSSSGIYVAIEQPPDTGIRMRGQDQPTEPSVTTTVPEVHSNINIPPGITFIFDNMFANRDLTYVIIPSRITSIGRNAFQGNPLLSVTIGANVSIEDSAIPGSFAAVYNAGGRAAGTYTRPDINSEVWEKK